MCGLYASVGFPPDPARMAIAAHRGPDGSGWRTFDAMAGPVALGHRRLAIIDLTEAGLQPMAGPGGRHHLIFNGEIYNYIELRDELRALGHVFTSESDSEVLLAAFAQWDEGCLDRLIGMFAFLIWDERDKRLFAARDRFGIKPLYVLANAHGIAFASEIKQLLGLPGLSGRLNPDRVHDFLVSGILDHTAETMFDGIRQLQPGSCGWIDAGRSWRGDFVPRRWYAPPVAEPANLSRGEAAELYGELLTRSVRMHLRSDVPVGSCLSGGIDSSSIVGLMARMLDAEGAGARVHSVSACYDERSIDEKPFMDAVVAANDAHPHFVFPKADDVLARASDLTWHQDEPFGSTSIFAQDCVFAEARDAGIKVMLDGQGADEPLAGYHAGYPYHLADLARRGDLLELAKTVKARRQHHAAPALMQLAAMAPMLLPDRLRARVRRGRATRRTSWLDNAAFSGDGPRDSALEIAARSNGLAPPTDLASLCAVQTFGSNLQMLLHWEDRSSMANGIESRVPFLDHRLVEFALQLGGSHKMAGAETKTVLREAMAGIVPRPVLQRTDKLGFATPEQTWFRGPLRPMIESGIETTLRLFPALFDAGQVRGLARDMLDGRRPVDFALWRIVNLGLWGERFAVTH